ncbi:uncharacterized protein C22orf31 [Astatotilapia calliptera]|uniref:uncharacterized protein C22orf31 n=1 Tax=Astatotilapia calliptera TaxID=8154 RepID=UPI000E4043F6|nr:uncharacterized protein C22orf31 homolog [Astatotilapia calliptera]
MQRNPEPAGNNRAAARTRGPGTVTEQSVSPGKGSEAQHPVPPSAISHDDLPVAKKLPPRPEPCSTDHQPTSSSDSPLKIHNLSVEDYQRVYHEVVDSMLTSKNGRKHTYSLELGRSTKKKLWERLNRPMVETSTNEDGLEKIDIAYGQKVKIPQYDFL